MKVGKEVRNQCFSKKSPTQAASETTTLVTPTTSTTTTEIQTEAITEKSTTVSTPTETTTESKTVAPETAKIENEAPKDKWYSAYVKPFSGLGK